MKILIDINYIAYMLSLMNIIPHGRFKGEVGRSADGQLSLMAAASPRETAERDPATELGGCWR